MRIGIDASFFNERFEGGKEIVLMNLLKGFSEMGIRPTVFCNAGARKKFVAVCPSADWVSIGFIEKLKTRKIIKGMLFRTLILPKMVSGMGLDILLFPVAYTGFAGFECPTAVIPHDIQFKSNPGIYKNWERWIFDWLYGSDFKKRDAVVAISGYDEGELHKHFGKFGGKIRRIYNPVDFGVEKGCFFDSGGPYIFANNLMYIHKNPDVLLSASNLLWEKGWDGRLVISGRVFIGNAETREALRRGTESGRVVLTGHVSDEEMKTLLSGASVFVNPSSFEGFGMSAVEAMGAGVPCVLADNSAVREVTLGRAFYYGPARNEEALARCLLDVLKNPPTPSFLEETAGLIRRSYDYRIIAEEYMKLFETLG